MSPAWVPLGGAFAARRTSTVLSLFSRVTTVTDLTDSVSALALSLLIRHTSIVLVPGTLAPCLTAGNDVGAGAFNTLTLKNVGGGGWGGASLEVEDEVEGILECE